MKNIILSILLLLSFNIFAKKKNVEIEVANDSISSDSIIISQEPVLTLDIESYHFGIIDTLRQDLEYDFNFCNEGLDTLKIHRIITAPGVTILERELIDQYAFDEGGTIRFFIDPK